MKDKALESLISVKRFHSSRKIPFLRAMQNSFTLNKPLYTRKLAEGIDLLVLILAPLSGLLHPDSKVYFESVVYVFLILAVPLMIFSFLIYRFSENHGNRIQGERTKNPPVLYEAFGSVRAMFIVACMAGWLVGMSRMGLPTGLVWTVEEMGLTWWMVILEM